MFVHKFMLRFDDEPLKKFRTVLSVVFFLFYIVLYYLVFQAKLDMMEYNRVWLSFDTKVLTEYYNKMSQEGTFFYYTLGHILDMFFVFIYTAFYLSLAELTKRTSSAGKKHWKVANIFIGALIIMPFLDWFETGFLLASVAAYPNIPLWIMYAHVIGKSAAMLIFYPLIIWFVYLAARAVIRKIRKT